MSKPADYCPIKDKSEAVWSVPLPEADIMNAPDLWAAILDPECKTKGRLIAVQQAALSKLGMFGNRCPQPVRDKVKKMSL